MVDPARQRHDDKRDIEEPVDHACKGQLGLAVGVEGDGMTLDQCPEDTRRAQQEGESEY